MLFLFHGRGGRWSPTSCAFEPWLCHHGKPVKRATRWVCGLIASFDEIFGCASGETLSYPQIHPSWIRRFQPIDHLGYRKKLRRNTSTQWLQNTSGKLTFKKHTSRVRMSETYVQSPSLFSIFSHIPSIMKVGLVGECTVSNSLISHLYHLSHCTVLKQTYTDILLFHSMYHMHLKCLAATEVTCWLAFSTNRFFDHQRLVAARPGNNGFAQCLHWWNDPPHLPLKHLVTLAVEPGIQGGIARSTNGDFGIQAIAQKEQTICAGVALLLPWLSPSFFHLEVKFFDLNNEQQRMIFLGNVGSSNIKRKAETLIFLPAFLCQNLPPSFAPASSISTSWSNANSKGDKNSPWSKR